jgi:hypothetical protein
MNNKKDANNKDLIFKLIDILLVESHKIKHQKIQLIRKIDSQKIIRTSIKTLFFCKYFKLIIK